MRRSVRTFGLAVTVVPLLAALQTAPAWATPIAPSVDSAGIVQFLVNDSTPTVVSTPCSTVSTVGATVGCSGSATSPTTTSTLDYLTTAGAGYGVLKAGGQSSINASVSNTTDYSTAYGSSYFDDSWIITGGTGTGTLDLQFGLDGTYNFCSGGLYFGFSLFNFDSSTSSSSQLNPVGCSGTVSRTVTLATAFTFGTPVDFRVSLQAGSDLFNLGTAGSSDIDFSDTAQMNAIVVMNSSGAVVPYDLTTASGAPLFSELAPSGVPTSSVPEPLSLSLFGAGLIGTVALRRRKSKA
jgi:hypothetical protein